MSLVAHEQETDIPTNDAVYPFGVYCAGIHYTCTIQLGRRLLLAGGGATAGIGYSYAASSTRRAAEWQVKRAPHTRSVPTPEVRQPGTASTRGRR
jgi:hypothetical protein